MIYSYYYCIVTQLGRALHKLSSNEAWKIYVLENTRDSQLVGQGKTLCCSSNYQKLTAECQKHWATRQWVLQMHNLSQWWQFTDQIMILALAASIIIQFWANRRQLSSVRRGRSGHPDKLWWFLIKPFGLVQCHPLTVRWTAAYERTKRRSTERLAI